MRQYPPWLRTRRKVTGHMQVRTLPDAPSYDAVAQLEEHCPVTAKAAGSRPVSIAKFEQRMAD